MDSLQQRLASASLAENLSSITAQIQANPADVDLRAAFVQLLCLAGNWNRAQTQLKSWLAMLPQAQPTVTLLQQAIEGEQLRAAVLRGEAEPQLPGSAWPWCEVLLAALKADIAGDKTAGTALRAQALESAEASAGKATTQEGESQFAWIMDGDSRFGPICEAIANGRYYWIPFAAISEIEFQAPASVTDLVWRHTRLQLVDGSEQICQIPVRYPLQEGADERFLRASVTEWQALDSEDGQFIGHGQKMWLSDEADYPVLTLQQLIFNETELAHES